MSIWSKLASLLGVRDDQVDDALADGRRAQMQLDRRGFLLAGAALAAGALAPKALWSIPKPGAITLVSFDETLKALYRDDRIQELVYTAPGPKDWLFLAGDFDEATARAAADAAIFGNGLVEVRPGQSIRHVSILSDEARAWVDRQKAKGL